MLAELALIVAVWVWRELISPLCWPVFPARPEVLTVHGTRCPECGHEVDWAYQTQEWGSRPVEEHAMRWHWAATHRQRLRRVEFV